MYFTKHFFVGHRVAKLNLEKMRCLFEKSLDIADLVITVNACNAEDKDFEILKEMLKQMATDILVRAFTLQVYSIVSTRLSLLHFLYTSLQLGI